MVFLHDIVNKWATWLLANLPTFAKTAIILAIGWYLAGNIKKLIARTSARLKWDPVISEYVANTFRYIVLAIFLIVALRTMGFPVTSFLATLGVSGIVIGMGLRGELGNYFAGLMMLGARPFGKGDLIEFGPPPQIGIVRDVRMMYTVLDGADNVRIIVPNAVLWRNRIYNFSSNRQRAINITIKIPYDVEVDWVKRIAFDVLGRHTAVLDVPAPRFTISDASSDSVRALLVAWSDVDSMNVFGDVITQMRKEFEVAELSVVVPSKDVDLKREE